LHAVADDGVQRRIKVEFQPYTMAQYLSQHQTDDVVDNIVDVEWCILRIGFLG
jgi:hypothetical protein